MWSTKISDRRKMFKNNQTNKWANKNPSSPSSSWCPHQNPRFITLQLPGLQWDLATLWPDWDMDMIRGCTLLQGCRAICRMIWRENWALCVTTSVRNKKWISNVTVTVSPVSNFACLWFCLSESCCFSLEVMKTGTK